MRGNHEGAGRQEEVSWKHPGTAMVLFGLGYVCWLLVIAVLLSIDFGHMPTQVAQPMLTVLGVLGVLAGLLSWGAADEELRGLAPRAIWGGAACLIAAQLAGFFAR